MQKTASPFNLLLSVNLYNLRREAKLSKKEAAARINVIPQVYSHLEQGLYPFSDEIVDAICGYYKIERHKFVSLSEDMRRQIINAEELIKQQEKTIKKMEGEIKQQQKNYETVFDFMEVLKKRIDFLLNLKSV